MPARSLTSRYLLLTIASLLVATGVTWWPASPLGADPTGTIRGTVTVASPPAPLAPHVIGPGAAPCGAAVPNDELLVAPGGGLANAIVWIEGAAAPVTRSAREVRLDQQGCRFTPHVATATVGDTLALTSGDAFLHNVHASVGARTAFNVAIPVAGLVVKKPLRAAGRLTIRCDVHPWMSAHVHVFAHPYHAVSAIDGTFRITRVPAGVHVAKVWHERLGERSANVTLRGGTATISFAY